MPQLRSADTSALIAEGDDARLLAVIARQVGFDRVLFDGVGRDFDPRHAADERGPDVPAKAAAAIDAALEDSAPNPTPVVVQA